MNASSTGQPGGILLSKPSVHWVHAVHLVHLDVVDGVDNVDQITRRERGDARTI